MQTKQTIAVIGKIEGWGPEVYKNISEGNYRILFPGSVREASEKIIKDIKSQNSLADIESIDCMVNACWEADIIITSVPVENVAESNLKLQRVACQKTVIVVINDPGGIPGDQQILLLAASVQQLLPYSKIIVAITNRTNRDNNNNGLIVLQNATANRDREALESAAELLRLAGFSIKEAKRNLVTKQSILN